MLNLPRYGFAATLLMVLLVGILKSSATEIPDSATASLAVSVQDETGSLIAGAKVEALRWTGQYAPLGISAQTDAEGSLALAGLPVDESLYIRISADGYGSKTPRIRKTPLQREGLNGKQAMRLAD